MPPNERESGTRPAERRIPNPRRLPTHIAAIRAERREGEQPEMNSTPTHSSQRTATAWVVALTAIGSLMAALDTLVGSTSLSTIRLDLGGVGHAGDEAADRGAALAGIEQGAAGGLVVVEERERLVDRGDAGVSPRCCSRR